MPSVCQDGEKGSNSRLSYLRFDYEYLMHCVLAGNDLCGSLTGVKTGFGAMKIGFGSTFYEMVLDLSSLVLGRNSLTSFFSISRLIITLRHLIISHYISSTPPPTKSKRPKLSIRKI